MHSRGSKIKGRWRWPDSAKNLIIWNNLHMLHSWLKDFYCISNWFLKNTVQRQPGGGYHTCSAKENFTRLVKLMLCECRADWAGSITLVLAGAPRRTVTEQLFSKHSVHILYKNFSVLPCSFNTKLCDIYWLCSGNAEQPWIKYKPTMLCECCHCSAFASPDSPVPWKPCLQNKCDTPLTQAPTHTEHKWKKMGLPFGIHGLPVRVRPPSMKNSRLYPAWSAWVT